jgi:hypothetical protein
MDLVSPQPFWPLRNGLLSVYPSLKEDVTCDIVVLGGGISGAFVDRAFVGGEDDSFRNPARRDRLVTPRTDQLAKRFGEMFPAIELEVAYR